jgi:hypothetical protein
VALAAAGVLAGVLGVSRVSATYDTWWASGTYARTDPYVTHFTAQTALWYDPVTNGYGPGASIWRTYLFMDVTVNSPSEYLNCDADQISGAAQTTSWRNWFNAPFPLNYGNTPAYDYNTWTSVYNYYMSQEFGASRDEQCNTSGHVPPGAWFSHDTTGSFVGGAW